MKDCDWRGSNKECAKSGCIEELAGLSKKCFVRFKNILKESNSENIGNRLRGLSRIKMFYIPSITQTGKIHGLTSQLIVKLDENLDDVYNRYM